MGGAKAFLTEKEEQEERRVRAVANKKGIECSWCSRTPVTREELEFFIETGKCPDCYESDLKEN